MDSWSDLPYDLLEKIAQKLRYKELLYFSFICKPWRFFYLENRCHLPFLLQSHPVPFLLQSCKTDSDSRKYVCVVDEKVQGEIFLPEAANKWIYGSFRDWLVMRDIKGQEIILLNSFTRCEIKLPSLVLICKAIISADPISNPEDCVVMAVAGDIKRLHFCKLGDSEWTNVKGSPSKFEDVIHYQDRFYAITQSSILASYAGKNPNAHEAEYVCCGPGSDYIGRQRYLVPLGETNYKYKEYMDCPLAILSISRKRPTVKFEVLKLVKRKSRANNESKDTGVLSSFCFFIQKLFKKETYIERMTHWSEVESVHDQLIFVGINCSFSVPSSAHPNCKGNTIYFGDDCRFTHCSNLLLTDLDLDQYPFKYYHHDIGVYDMEDKCSRSFHESGQFGILPAIWIVPRPW